MGRLIHFELISAEPERSAAFYRDVFGWEVTEPMGAEKYWLLTTGPDSETGINGGVMGPHFSQPVINTVQVSSLSEALERVARAGGKKVDGPREIPGIGTHAYCSDPNGTVFGILEPPRSE